MEREEILRNCNNNSFAKNEPRVRSEEFSLHRNIKLRIPEKYRKKVSSGKWLFIQTAVRLDIGPEVVHQIDFYTLSLPNLGHK